MKIVRPICCGMDVHKNIIVATIGITVMKWRLSSGNITFLWFSSFPSFRLFFIILIKDIGQETSIQIYRRLATLLCVDWLPQVNGFAASFFVYSRESNLLYKKCLHRVVLNNLNHLLIEISCPISLIPFRYYILILLITIKTLSNNFNSLCN